MSGTDFIELSGRVDATFKNFSGAGCEDMVAWATDPEQLRGINFNMSFNDDEVKLLARIDNPFKDRELGMEIKSILTSESEVGVSKNRIQKMVDKMNKLLRPKSISRATVTLRQQSGWHILIEPLLTTTLRDSILLNG
jgi:hypothetical protein